MKIELTKQQYRSLIELLFLGDWLVNATRTGAEDDKRISKYEEVQQLIYSYGKDFEADDFLIEKYGQLFTTMEFEEPLMPLVDEYDDYTFWEQLSLRLAERDLQREIVPVRKLKEEHMLRKYELEEMYQEEFEENGLRNLVVHRTKKSV
jgi:hypothetical protein